MNAGAHRGTNHPVKLAAVALHLAPVKWLTSLENMACYRTASDIGIGVDRMLVAEPVTFYPVDAFDHFVACRCGGKQDEAVVTKGRGKGANQLLNHRKRLGTLDPKGSSKRRLGHSLSHPAATSFSNAAAASLPRALPASGLSPVRSFRSWWVAPEMSLLMISKPSFFSSSPNFQVRWPGM